MLLWKSCHGALSEAFRTDLAEEICSWHRTIPLYRETPLVSLSSLAGNLGVASIHVKDESFRFGLNAFKALGASHAMGSIIARRLGTCLGSLPFPVLTGKEIRERAGEIVWITATDGNHGRGVAWTARCLHQKAVVLLPAHTVPERLKSIEALGARVTMTDLTYDDTVRLAASLARQNGWVLVQDTAWEGYETVPLSIMQGYMTIGIELISQLADLWPSHVFLQAGVGSMAAALAAFLAHVQDHPCPKIIIVEPESADCFYRTAAAHDGRLHNADSMHSIMAGLCCGEPSPLAWDILSKQADAFLTIPDSAAATGMRILGHPLPGDSRIQSGESGAAGLGAFAWIMRNNPEVREALEIDTNARILCISTEGITDPDNYRRIVWDGAYPDV